MCRSKSRTQASGTTRRSRTAERLLRDASAPVPSGRYQLEAAIQSAHTARRAGRCAELANRGALYDHLLALTRSPVVALNRAVALAEVEGPDAALAALEPLAADKRMLSYQPYWAARGHLLARAGNRSDAAEAFTVAIGLTTDEAVTRVPAPAAATTCATAEPC